MKGSDYGLKLERGDGCMYAIREDGEQWLKIEGGNEQTDRAELTRIVRCVNAHDDLVEALERLLRVPTSPDAIAEAHAALAKAKGDTPDEG